MTNETTALVRQMRDALVAVESPVDIGLQRRKAIAAADAWLAQPPIEWERRAGGLKNLTNEQYQAQPDAIKQHYSRIGVSDERAEFESWFKRHANKVHLERCGDTYFGDWAACAWEGWQARAGARK